MLVKLIGNKRCITMNLPDEVEGNYWLTDFVDGEVQKLVNIKGVRGKWIATSNNNSKIINENFIKGNGEEVHTINSKGSVIEEVGLELYKPIYFISKMDDHIYTLYCYPTIEEKFSVYEVKVKEISIGSDSENTIAIRNSKIRKVATRIIVRNGGWHIENYDSYMGVFLNDRYVEKDKDEAIENGDIIFVYGLKLMFINNKLIIFGNLGEISGLSSENFTRANIPEPTSSAEKKPDEEYEDIELFQEKDYFHSAPRISLNNTEKNIQIDQPPQGQNASNPMGFLSIVTTLGMSSVTIISLITTITTLQNGNVPKSQVIMRVAMSITMLITMLVLPIVRMIVTKKQKRKYEKRRQTEYIKYINSKIVNINTAIKNEEKKLKDNNLIADQCERVIVEHSKQLWQRSISDNDFLEINLGNGKKEIDLGIKRAEKKFSLDKDNLLDIYYEVVNNAREVDGIPICTNIAKNNKFAVVGSDKSRMLDYMKNMIVQLIALQSYRNLKLVFMVEKENEWKYVKLFPHVWDDTNKIRFFGTTDDEIKSLSVYLENVMAERTPDESNTILLSNKERTYKDYNQYYVIITDRYKQFNDLGIFNKILKNNQNLGFSLCILSNDMSSLPNSCQMFLNVEKKEVKLLEKKDEENTSVKTGIVPDISEGFNMGKIAKVMGNIPIKFVSEKAESLPDKYNFLEMFGCGNIEQLNISARWKESNSVDTLKAPIGIDGRGGLIYLDAHEKYHGPHGLIAGTTGSGKSEFIITYILSLAINYNPDDVTFVLVDYKGGGLAGAFKKKNLQLPHLVGTITNIDSVELERSLESIQSELRRRQVMFNEAKNITNESTIDIYKYQKFYHDGILKEPISHLFIICDEFAELKQQQPDFMQELMSVSRIGRSLGVHLILATQKPAGIVNDQIRSNSKFGVCLKVQDRSDSKDIIKKPDAASLKNAGQFYINVGNDEYFALGQSAYTGTPYIKSDYVKKEKNNSIEFISNTGSVIRKIEEQKKQVVQKGNGDQLTNIVAYLSELARKKALEEKQLWLDPIPENIYIKNLRKKYKVVAKKNIINPIIGEYDDPFNQLQGIATLNLSKDGNTVIYGSSDSGKELVIEAMLYDTMINHTVDEVNFYLMDFGSETLKNFSKMPHVGDVILTEDTEKVARLFKILKKEIKTRKEKLLEYNGDYSLFLKQSDESMPMIVIVINDYANFMQNYSVYEDELANMTKEGNKYGITFVITGNTYNDIRMRIIQNCKKKLALQLISDDYSMVFSKARKKKPSSLYGRGLLTIEDDTVFEFQSARMCKAEVVNEFTKKLAIKLNSIYKKTAPRIPVLPKLVTLHDVQNSIAGIESLPIGISSKNIEPYCYNFKEQIASVIITKDLEILRPFILNLVKEMKSIENVDVGIIDLEQIINKTEVNFVDEFNNLTNRLNNNMEHKEDKQIVYIFIGVDKAVAQLGQYKDLLVQNMNAAKTAGNCNFIMVDTVTKMKNHAIDAWYTSYVTPGYGIYVGNGFDSQYTITYETDRKNINPNCGDSFGYAIVKNKPVYIKMLGIEEKEEE